MRTNKQHNPHLMAPTWEEHWRTGHTPWDALGSPPALDHWLAITQRGPGRALVPGCGAGYDVFTLARAGYTVTGLDLAPSVRPRFEQLREEAGLSDQLARLVIEDFFAWEPERPFDVIWDYTFLCALERSERPRWKARQLDLLAEDGELVTLLFPVDPKRPLDEGPPYSLDPEELRHLLAPELIPISMEPPPESHPARRGREILARWSRAG